MKPRHRPIGLLKDPHLAQAQAHQPERVAAVLLSTVTRNTNTNLHVWPGQRCPWYRDYRPQGVYLRQRRQTTQPIRPVNPLLSASLLA